MSSKDSDFLNDVPTPAMPKIAQRRQKSPDRKGLPGSTGNEREDTSIPKLTQTIAEPEKAVKSPQKAVVDGPKSESRIPPGPPLPEGMRTHVMIPTPKPKPLRPVIKAKAGDTTNKTAVKLSKPTKSELPSPLEAPEQGDMVSPTEPVLLLGNPLPDHMKERWPLLLSEISPETKAGIWEMKIHGMEVLLKLSRAELTDPTGQLTVKQVDEIDNWVRQHGYQLPKTPPKLQRPVGGPIKQKIDLTLKQGNREKALARIDRMSKLQSGG